MGIEVGILLMQQLMDSLHIEQPGLLLELLHHWGPWYLCLTQICGPLEYSWRGCRHGKSYGDRSVLNGGWSNTFQCIQQHVLDSSGHMPGYFSFMAVQRSRFHNSALHCRWCQGPWFSLDEDMKAMVVQWFQLQLKEFFCRGDSSAAVWMECLSEFTWREIFLWRHMFLFNQDFNLRWVSLCFL